MAALQIFKDVKEEIKEDLDIFVVNRSPPPAWGRRPPVDGRLAAFATCCSFLLQYQMQAAQFVIWTLHFRLVQVADFPNFGLWRVIWILQVSTGAERLELWSVFRLLLCI